MELSQRRIDIAIKAIIDQIERDCDMFDEDIQYICVSVEDGDFIADLDVEARFHLSERNQFGGVHSALVSVEIYDNGCTCENESALEIGYDSLHAIECGVLSQQVQKYYEPELW